MRLTGPIRLLLRGLLFLPLLFVPTLLDGILALSGTEARHLADYEVLATRLRSGQTIRIGWNLRALKLFATSKPPSSSILVLGSSRALAVSQAWFPSQSLWNASVTAGTLEDSAALLQTALNAGRIPSTVILEVSPALSRDPVPGTSRALDVARDRALARYGVHVPAPSSWFFGLNISWSDALRRFISTTSETSGAPSPSTVEYTVTPDGAVLLFDLDAGGADARRVSGELLQLPPEQLEARSQSVPTPEYARLFRQMLDDLHSRGIRVIILTPPIHPFAWDFFHRRGGYDDQWLRRELTPRGIPIVGTFSPAGSHVTEADFYDAFHPRPAVLRRLLTEAGIIPAQ